MLPKDLDDRLKAMLAHSERPREKVVDVIYALQKHYGYFSDEAVAEASRLTGMTELELEELATFYDFIYREPVGRYVIHVCDSVVCWMFHEDSIFKYLTRKLGVGPGEVTPDGLFTVLPTACLGYCHRAPAMLVNGEPFGPLTPEYIDAILERLRTVRCDIVECR